eukprot:g13591.t1
MGRPFELLRELGQTYRSLERDSVQAQLHQAESEAKINFLETQLLVQEKLNLDLGRRVKMLEQILLKERHELRVLKKTLAEGGGGQMEVEVEKNKAGEAGGEIGGMKSTKTTPATRTAPDSNTSSSPEQETKGGAAPGTAGAGGAPSSSSSAGTGSSTLSKLSEIAQRLPQSRAVSARQKLRQYLQTSLFLNDTLEADLLDQIGSGEIPEINSEVVPHQTSTELVKQDWRWYASVEGPFCGAVQKLCYDNQRAILISGSEDGVMCLFDMHDFNTSEDVEPFHVLRNPGGRKITAMAADFVTSNIFVTGDISGSVTLWKVGLRAHTAAQETAELRDKNKQTPPDSSFDFLEEITDLSLRAPHIIAVSTKTEVHLLKISPHNPALGLSKINTVFKPYEEEEEVDLDTAGEDNLVSAVEKKSKLESDSEEDKGKEVKESGSIKKGSSRSMKTTYYPSQVAFVKDDLLVVGFKCLTTRCQQEGNASSTRTIKSATMYEIVEEDEESAKKSTDKSKEDDGERGKVEEDVENEGGKGHKDGNESATKKNSSTSSEKEGTSKNGDVDDGGRTSGSSLGRLIAEEDFAVLATEQGLLPRETSTSTRRVDITGLSYDSATGKVVLGVGSLGEVWVYDVKGQSITQRIESFTESLDALLLGVEDVLFVGGLSVCQRSSGAEVSSEDDHGDGAEAVEKMGGKGKKSPSSSTGGENKEKGAKNAAAGKSRASTSSQFPVTFQALQTGTETEDAAGEPSSDLIRASMDQVQKEVAYNQSYYPGRFDEYERASAARMTSAQGGSGAAQPMSGIVTQLAEQSYASYGPSNPGDEPGSPNPKYAKAGSAAVPATAPTSVTRAGPLASGMPDVGTNRLPSGY